MFHCILHTPHILLLFILLCVSYQRTVHCYPAHSTDGSELVVAEEIVRCTPDWCRNVTDTEDTAQNESVMDAVDDLIFLAKKPKQRLVGVAKSRNQQPQQHYPHQQTTAATYRPIDLLKSSTQDPLAATYEKFAAYFASLHPDEGNGASISDSDSDSFGDESVSHEIELRTAHSAAAAASITPIDMSDFVSLIPAEKVKSIAANYYKHDAEVRRAYAYLKSADFAELRQQIIELPEVAAFLRYLNNSGLDVLGFVYTLTNLTTNKAVPNSSIKPNVAENANAVLYGILRSTEENKIATTTAQQPILGATSASASTPLEATTKQAQQQEHLNGLHGLVDSILEILPQDEILTTFFDKLESNEQFSKLVDNIGSPEFAKILSDMEKSVPLRNFIYILHNNGIYITRIVDSLKTYFFLGGFK